MELAIHREEQLIKIQVSFQENNVEFTFDLCEMANLTDFAKYISDSTSQIVCVPDSYVSYKSIDSEMTEHQDKFIKYLYEIIFSFNDSYKEVFEVE